MSIVRLIYFSESHLDWSKASMIQGLVDILGACERHNATAGLTGALAFDNDWFVQVLEGPLDDVWATYNRIGHDPRHSNIRFVEMKTTPSRRFADWRMGCAERGAETDAVFAPYLYDGRFAPANMSGDMILSLMLDLSLGHFDRPSESAAPLPA